MLAVAVGDPSAFTAVYIRLLPHVLATVQRQVPVRAQAEEVAQEVILDLWRAAGRYQPATGTVTGWVTGLARRRAVDRYRQQARTERREHYAGGRPQPDGDRLPEGVVRREEHREVRAALQELTALQSEAIICAYYREHTHRHAADLLGIPLGTFKTRVRDGLTALRHTLQTYALER